MRNADFAISLALPGAIAGVGAAGAAATSSVAGGDNTISAFASGLTSGAIGLAAAGCDGAIATVCAGWPGTRRIRLRLLNSRRFDGLCRRHGRHCRRNGLGRCRRRRVGRGDLLPVYPSRRARCRSTPSCRLATQGGQPARHVLPRAGAPPARPGRIPLQPAPQRRSRAPHGAGPTAPGTTSSYRPGRRGCRVARRYRRHQENRAVGPAAVRSNRGTGSGAAKSNFST